eukprot:13909921-Alexandrium_andersonii.AAC.1
MQPASLTLRPTGPEPLLALGAHPNLRSGWTPHLPSDRGESQLRPAMRASRKVATSHDRGRGGGCKRGSCTGTAGCRR